MTTRAHIDFHAELDRARPAIIMGSGTVTTYADIVDGSRRFARVLREFGVGPGQTAAIMLENRPEFMVAAWGMQRAGLKYTSIATRLRATEVAYLLCDSGARVVVTSAKYAGTIADALQLYQPGEMKPVVLTLGGGAGFASFEEAINAQPPLPAADEAEGMPLFYTSGTTGRPKGVVHVGEDDLRPLGEPPSIEAVMRDEYRFDSDTVFLSPAPLYHAAPLRYNLMTERFGGTSVIMERFDAEQALALIEQYRVTHTQMVPTMFVRMLRLPEETRLRYDVSSLKVVLHSAAPCPPEVKAQMIDWFGPIIREYYGTTERNLFTSISAEESRIKPGSVGRPVVGVAHILDDAGNELPAGQTGTIWSEGGTEFVYHNNPQATARSHNERGWATVSDLGYLDEDGYLYLSDRRVDLIIAGGVNIYPREVEEALLFHPAVDDVAVIGVPNRDLGQEVKAIVKLRDPRQVSASLAEELIAYCLDRLAPFKCPRSIDFLEDFPRDDTGKLFKRELMRRYENASVAAE
jgi:long-chain acyl-CoA synthetase